MMVERCLDSWFFRAESSDRPGRSPHSDVRLPRLIDPSCGNGAFLVEAFDQLCNRLIPSKPAEDRRARSPIAQVKLQIVRQCLFGIDVDPGAVNELRHRILQRIAPSTDLAAEANRVVQDNFRIGDALTGIDFAPDHFDLVIGNPPYLREKDAKDLFDRIAATSFGKTWRQARMDLWHFFVHRGLDLLRPGGRLCFIVNSYWTASRGASRLRDRLSDETTFEEIVHFDDAPIFDGVAGRHMVFRLRKEPPGPDSECVIEKWSDTAGHKCRRLTLLSRDVLRCERQEADQAVSNGKPIRTRATLGERFIVRQGIAENPPAINHRLNREFGDAFRVGEGVYVLSQLEIDELRLSETERRFLRPYYDTVQLGRFRLPDAPTQWLLYLDRSCTSLDNLPNIARHLSRFRPILERRREVKRGLIPWWQLHWPREEVLFTRPRILSVQMGRQPQFVFADRPTFVGFSVNVITAGPEQDLGLEALAAILNSGWAEDWFERHAKHRGVRLEINGHVLRDFPLPARNRDLEHAVVELARRRQASEADDSANTEEIGELEADLERLTRRMFDGDP